MPGTYDWIAGTTLTGNAAGITVSSIPGTYTDLVAILVAKDVRNIGISTDLIVYANGVTSGSDYNYQVANANTSNVYSAFQSSNAGLFIPLGGNGLPGQFFTYRFEFLNYASSQQKTMLTFGGSTEPSNTNPRFGVAYYRVSSAITSLTFNGEHGLVANTSLNIYGILKA